MTKKHKRKHSGRGLEDSTKEKQDVCVQEIMGSEGHDACVPHKQNNLDNICNKPKHKTHKTGENGISESQQIEEIVSESPHVESVSSEHSSATVACIPEKSVELTKALKRKNSDVTGDKQKRKKKKTREKECSESQELDASGYHEPVTEASVFNLDEVLESSAQKDICDTNRKKSVDFKTAPKSYPMLSKGTDEQTNICKELEKEGKKYNTGQFSQEENDQLRKNWRKLTKSCPFDEPHVLLMKNHFPHLQKDIEAYAKDTDFYIRLGKHINRPQCNVYARARKMFHPRNGKGRYTLPLENGSEEGEVCVPENVSSTEIISSNCNVIRLEKHKQQNLDNICNKPKHKTHKAGENGISESQQIEEIMSKSPHVESVSSDHSSATDACTSEKSVESTKLTKALKRKNSDVTGDKQKRKKQKTREKECSESQELDVSGYHEPVIKARAEKVIRNTYRKKSVDFKTAPKSHPMLSKGTEEQSSGRHAEFKGRNCVHYNTWKKIRKDLEKEGIKYNSGRFSQEENDQLKKNWRKLTKSCPFEEPHVLLMKNHFPHLQRDIEAYVRDTDFYIRLGKHINRPLYNVYIRARKMFHPGFGKGSFTKEEVELLKKQHYEHGSHWQKIAQSMDRSGQSLNDKFRMLKTHAGFGRWNAEEDDQLREAVKSNVTDRTNDQEAYFNFPWTDIARSVPSRNAKQCRDHWLNLLAFGNKGKNKFEKEDKIRLIYEIMAMNVSHESEIDWIELKSKFDVPSPQYLQHKWYLLKIKVPDVQRCTLIEVLEYLEREVVPVMKAAVEKKRDRSDIADVFQVGCSETSSQSDVKLEEATSDEEEGDER